MRVFGQITMMNDSRGFGFITAENGTGDFFFHMSGCRAFKSLRLYDRVSFVSVSAPKGSRAEDVAIASIEGVVTVVPIASNGVTVAQGQGTIVNPVCATSETRS